MIKKHYLFIWLWIFLLGIGVHAGSYDLGSGSDKLSVGEQFDDVITSITSSQLSELKSGTIESGEGLTDYNQYISFEDLTRPLVTFEKNDDGDVADFLFFEKGTSATQAFVEYKVEFESGLKSKVQEGVLTDLIDEDVNIFDSNGEVIIGGKCDNDGHLIDRKFVDQLCLYFITDETVRDLKLRRTSQELKEYGQDEKRDFYVTGKTTYHQM
mgnify:CR=1 FL=1